MTVERSVIQLRLVVEAEDYESAVHFYRDVLGMPEELAVSGPNGAQVMILDAGRATLELANPAQKRYIDEVEVGRQVAPKFRLALQVTDGRATTERLVEAGAELLAPPAETPWRSLNSRLQTPGGIELTLFEEIADHPHLGGGEHSEG
ncbi:MAG TPA: VOC family protein [Candidatus Limnocylindrales bacterium]|nr:VOC family protein [Candidatus Limnocylindrales bacterium]